MKLKEYIIKKYMSIILGTFILIGTIDGLVFCLDFGFDSIFTSQYVKSVFMDITLFVIYIKAFLLTSWIKYKCRKK